MALDLSLKTGQWPERSDSSVITSTHSPYHEINRKSYQLQQNHHQLLETDKGFSYNNASATGSSVPISLVTTKNRQNHVHPNAGASPHRPNHVHVHARWGQPVSGHHHHHDRDHGHHGVIRRSVSSSNINGVFSNTPRLAHVHALANNGYVNVRAVSSPSRSPTPVLDVDDEVEPGELLIVEEHNSHRHTPRSRSITPSGVPYVHHAIQNQLPPTARGLKRILAEEENNDTSTSQLSVSTSTSYAHSTVTNTNASSQMRIRHPKKANIFLHQEELKQLNLNNNSSNSSSNSYASNNHNHNQDSKFAVASSPSPSPTRSPLQFQVVEITTNSNNVTSLQPCDSSSSVAVSSRNNLITSSTSPTPAVSKTEYVLRNNQVVPFVPLPVSTNNINGALAADKGKKVENKFTCTHCTKNFKKQSLLDAHMRLMQEKAKWKSFQKKKYIKTGNPPAPAPAQAPQPNSNSTSTSPMPNSTDTLAPNNATANGSK